MAAKRKQGKTPPKSDAPPEGSPEARAAELEWRSGVDSPNGRRVLDIRAASRSLLSTSTDEVAAQNVLAVSLPKDALRGQPVPEDAVTILVNWPLTAEEHARVTQGFRPETMEDKWRIVPRKAPGGHRVYFLRSWTNTLMAVLEIHDARGTSLAVGKGIFQPEATFRAILDSYLLDRACVLPAPSEEGTDKVRLMTWGISVAGRRCDYVEPAASRLFFPSSTALGLSADHENPSAIERLLPRDLMEEGMMQRSSFGLTNVFRAVFAMLQPSREDALRLGFIPSADAVINHEELARLRGFLDAIAAMDEGQLRRVAESFTLTRADDESKAECIATFQDVPRSRWIVWGRGEPKHPWLFARPNGDAEQALLATVRREDPAFALGWAGWLVEIVATGGELLETVHGEGTVRGWFHAGEPPTISTSAVAPPLASPLLQSPRNSTREQRRAGAFLGLAVGDALGAAVEFKPPGTFPLVTGYRDGGPHGLGPGEWTDDTSMALALADSLACLDWDGADQARRYLAWWREGAYSVNGRCFDIGNATRAALARIENGTPARSAGDAADQSSGNGSIMRLAPVAMRYLDLFPGNVSQLASYAELSSAPTHRSPKCLSACRYLAVVLAALMDGRDRDEVLSPEWPILAELHGIEPLHPSILEVARGSYRRKQPPDIRGSGYVVDSLEAALWAFHQAPTFRDAVLAAVNLGDDADTTGAICGQLSGAYFGTGGMPVEWLEGLAKRHWLEDAVHRLSRPRGFSRRSTAESPPSYTVNPSRPAGSTQPLRLADASSQPPTDRCYWVIPGRLLAGAYPGHSDRAAHDARLEALWSADIRTFVSLMEEHETNNAGRPFTPYAETVARSAARDGAVARCERFPITDVSIPSVATMRAVLDCIDRELEANRGVYVHCFGGIGRTGTVVGCWLLRHGLASPDEVEKTLARLRIKDTERATRRSPETDGQFRFVTRWKE